LTLRVLNGTVLSRFSGLLKRTQKEPVTMKSVFVLIASILTVTAAAQAQQSLTSNPNLPSYLTGPSWFPTVLKPYQEGQVKPPVMENSPRLHDLIRDGKLRLSISDALALAIENNLDIAVQRFLHPIAEADVLRASSGQAARGIPGALLPSGLSQGALGVGVNQAQNFGGVGNAGGISGGGGAVQVPQVGTFDPSVNINFSLDRTLAPLNSLQVAGVPKVTTTSTALSGSYTQLFPTGTSFSYNLSGLRQNSTQQFLLYNPAIISRLTVGVNQPLLSGFGYLPNKRFMIVAANNMRTSDEVLRAQVTAAVVQVENAYWNLAAANESVLAAKLSLEVAERLDNETKGKLDVGIVPRIDLATTGSAVAAARRDLIVAQTSYQLQESQFKKLLSKRSDPELDAASIETTDELPEPSERDLPELNTAIAAALEERPELHIAQQDLANQDISSRFTRNGLLPNVSAFSLFAGSGLTGDSSTVSTGAAKSLGQDFAAQYPEYASGMTMVLPLRNRAAQADNLRARLEQQQLEVGIERLKQQVELEVRQAMVSLTQGKAQVEASTEALKLAGEVVDGEQARLESGVSTTYNVVLRQRDLATARQALISATVSYANALVDIHRATGATLKENGIELGDALTGEVTKQPRPPFQSFQKSNTGTK
jgi:outer membrane protein TolC